MAVPQRVQNFSLGIASFPHSAQVHPVRRKRTSRALIRSTPPGPAPGPPTPGPLVGPPPYGPGGGGTAVGGGGMVADAGDGTGEGCT
jgi:hypothetical protein